MDRQVLKEHAFLLKMIKEQEVLYPTQAVYESWSMDSGNMKMPSSIFFKFFDSMEKQGILKIHGHSRIPEGVIDITDKDTGEIREEEVYTDNVVIDYGNINLEKLIAYEGNILSLLTEDEIKNIRKKEVELRGVLKEAGPLRMHTGGLMSYENKHIDLRTGLRNLCEIFLDHPGELLDRSTLEDEMGIRTRDSKGTIAKYVSALNARLEKYYQRKPIKNFKKEGWIFNP